MILPGTEAATPSENASTSSCDFDGELAVVKERKRRKVNCSQDDVLRMQYECLSLKRENLSLKKKKLELQVHLLQRQVDEWRFNFLCVKCRTKQLMMWKVNEPIWFNESSVIYILMQRGFWDSLVHQQSVCRGKIVLLLINVSLSKKWCHGNTENTSMHSSCHMMWPQFIMTYRLLVLHFSLACFCEKSLQVKMLCYLGTVSSFVLVWRIILKGCLYKCSF